MAQDPLPEDGRRTIKTLAEGNLIVRVYYRANVKPLQMEIIRRDSSLPRGEREKRRSLGHADEARAITEAYGVLASLRAKDPTDRPAQGPLSLGQVVARYLDSIAFTSTTDRVQDERRTALTMCLNFVPEGAKSSWYAMNATHLAQEDILAYVQARTSGSYVNPEGSQDGVSIRRAQAELQALRTACNWAYSTKLKGKRLLVERVFDGLSLPEADAAAKPSTPDDVVAVLWAAAPKHAAPNYGLALACAYVYGKRSHSIRHLEWERVNLEKEARVLGSVLVPPGHIYWSREYDKENEAGVFPVPKDMVALFEAWRDNADRKPSPWVFYAPKNPDTPISRVSFQQWGNQGYRNARLTKPKQGGWHGYRRNFSGRNRDAAKAAMTIAGWKNLETFLAYQQPESAEILKVLNNRTLKFDGRAQLELSALVAK